MRTISPLADEEVTRVLFELGPRTLVLVEGDTDKDVFLLWYRDRLDRLHFVAPGGVDTVEKLLQRVIDAGASRAFAIIDRDFKTDAEVDGPLAAPDARLFVLRRYEVENYLLEPAAVAEELLHNVGPTAAPSTAQVETSLMELCAKLAVLAAADWFLSDRGEQHLAIGFDRFTEDEVAEHVAIRTSLDRVAVEGHVRMKLAALKVHLASLATAHVFIRGKRLLHHVERLFPQKVYKDHLIRLLARAVQTQCGLHPDITAIIDGRILK